MPEKIEYFLFSAEDYISATIFCVLERGVTTSVSVLGTDLALEAAQIQMKTAHLTSRSGLEVRRSECGGYALTHMHLTDPKRVRLSTVSHETAENPSKNARMSSGLRWM